MGMRRRTVYTLSLATRGLEKIELPFDLELEDGIHARLEQQEQALRLVLERKVDPSRLEVVPDSGWSRELPGGEKEALPALRLLDEDRREQVLARDFISAVTFLTELPLTLGHRMQDDLFVPDDEDEETQLEQFGTRRPYVGTAVQSQLRSLNARVDGNGVSALMKRAPGVRLYADAVKLTLAVAQFRELWRVLESAFAKEKRDELVALLADYPAAQQLGFDASELRELYMWRGRASHANGGGLDELVRVEYECGRRLGRLKNLVERVILTKEEWGCPTTGDSAVEELAPLQAYVRRDGTLVIIQGTASNGGDDPPEPEGAPGRV